MKFTFPVKLKPNNSTIFKKQDAIAPGLSDFYGIGQFLIKKKFILDGLNIKNTLNMTAVGYWEVIKRFKLLFESSTQRHSFLIHCKC